MTDIHIHIKDDIPVYIKIDGKSVPIDNFLLTTKVTNREEGHHLAFGNSDCLGKMLYNMWRVSVQDFPDLAATIELVARDILGDASSARRCFYECEDTDGITH